MTEIELHAPQQMPAVMDSGAASIAATARALVDAHNIGTALCRTAFVPKHFQGKPDDAAAAILYGATINMDPVTALQNVYVIGGKPALYARTMVAIVMSHGHQIWTEEESEGRVTVAGRRKDSEVIERVTWTTELAERAGYLSNAKYKTDPRSMLYARASGDVARRIAPDALLGMAHNVEELTIAEPWDGTTLPPTATTGADRIRARTTAEQVAPEAEPEAPDSITAAQLKKLGATMRDAGITERGQALAYVGDVIGREVESRNELTKDEAAKVIDALEADLREQA